MARRRRFTARNKRKTVLRLALLLLVPLLLAGGAYGVIQLLKGGGNKASLKEAPFAPGDVFTYTGAGFLYYKDGKLAFKHDTDKKSDYTLSVSSAAAALRLSAGAKLSALYNDTSVLITGADVPITPGGTVEKVICGSEHLAVFVSAETGGALQVFDAGGAQTDSLDFSASTLLDFGIDTTGAETLWTLTLDDSGGIPISTVTTYNLAQSVTDGLMSVQGELLEDVVFTGTSIFSVGTNHIIRYNRAGNAEVYRELIYGWRVTDYSPAASPVFLLQERADSGFARIRLYTLQEGELPAEKIASVQLPDDALCARLFNGKLAIFTPARVLFYDAAGAAQGALDFEAPMTAAEKLSETKALVQSADRCFVLDIK